MTGVSVQSDRPTFDVVQGIWKFADTIHVGDLLTVARELVAEDPYRYTSVTVRRCSRDQMGICFTCEITGGKEAYNAFHDRYCDKFYKKFGINFKGWDITDSVWVIPTTPWEFSVDTFLIKNLPRARFRTSFSDQSGKMDRVANLEFMLHQGNLKVRLLGGTAVRTVLGDKYLMPNDWTTIPYLPDESVDQLFRRSLYF